MANQKININQVYTQKSWSGLTTDNHLATMFAEHPTLVSPLVSQVFGMYQYVGLDYLLTRSGVKELPNDNAYEWFLKGDNRKAIPLIKAEFQGADVASQTNVGANGTTIKLHFAEKYFAYTDKLIFDDRRYSVVVVSEPYSDGVNWVYECRIMRADTALTIPAAQLLAGKRVSKLYSPQEQTLGKTYGQTTYSSPFKMRNHMSTLAKEYTIPGNMHDRGQLVIELVDEKGRKTNLWTRYAEWEFMCQWMREKDNNLLYSEYNINTNGTFDLKGSSGFEIIEGAGLREQISPSYKFEYSTFTVDFLLEVFTNLSINILPEDKRKFTLLTGERGMIQFHRAIRDYSALFVPLGDTSQYKGSGANRQFIEGQFRRYMGPQGVEVEVVNLPQYNDTIDNRTPHPDGGNTENYRYTVLNFGTAEGEPNITKVYPKGRRDMMAHIPGTVSPFGPKKSFSESTASKVDGYELICRTSQGIMIKNPLSCCELVYSAG
jgi:hypothetical protein